MTHVITLAIRRGYRPRPIRAAVVAPFKTIERSIGKVKRVFDFRGEPAPSGGARA